MPSIMLGCFSILFAFILSCRESHPLDPHHAQVEGLHKPWYSHLAEGDMARPTKLYPWPFELLSIGHTMASYQNYGGRPYFHHGIDIRGDAGAAVIMPTGGKVINIENYVPGDDAYWEVAVQDDDGYIWQFHHVEKESIPQNIHDALASGERIAAGTIIGEIFPWRNDTFGETYHHIHLNILGGGGRYLNPFAFLAPLPDSQPPEIVSIGLLQGGDAVEDTKISGDYQLYLEARDLILHDKFYVPPYEVTYSLDGAGPVTLWRFDSLPGIDSVTDHVEEFYVPALTCGDYECRKLTMNLGFRTAGLENFPENIGSHAITVRVRDFAGGSVEKTFYWQVEERSGIVVSKQN